jgi:hypothetical protein
MNQMNLPPRQKMRALFWLGFFCWLATVATAGVYVWSFRTMRWPPDYRWMLATLGAAIVFGTLCVLVGAFNFLRGPRRIAAIAGLFFGSLPIVLIGLAFGELYWRATTRQNIERGILVDPMAYLASDVGDGEVALRKLRRTAGQYCILIDDGKHKDPSAVISKMDAHITAMSDILGVRPKKVAYWVRHPLLGDRGRSMMGWAVCDQVTNGTEDELNYLDKHEMAHAVMSLTCSPESNPATILGEGWAETQSRDVVEMCQALVVNRQNDPDFPTWQEMIRPEWYSRSFGAVYAWGGPVVAFLLEKHGGTTFHKLYNETRHATFEADFLRVYGKSWKDMESDFEDWLVAKVPDAIAAAQKPTTDKPLDERITLADEVTKADWETMWSTAKGLHEARVKPSRGSGLRAMTEAKDDSGQTIRTTLQQWRIFYSDDESLFARETISGSDARGITPEKSITASRVATETRRSGCLVTARSEKENLRKSIRYLWIESWCAGNLFQTLELLTGPTGSLTIDSLSEDFETRMWTLKATGQSASETPFSLEATIDSGKGWRCVQLNRREGTTSTNQSFTLRPLNGDWVTSEVSTRVTVDGKEGPAFITKLTSLSDRDILSLRDEIMSIPVKSCENGLEVPVWLQLLRYTGGVWAAIGILFGMFIKLFRI